MKRKLSISLFLLLVLTLVFSSILFAQDLPAPRIVEDRPLKVGYLYMGPVADSLKRHFRQANIEVAHRGWEITEFASQDASEQREGFRDLMESDVDAIVLTYLHMEALEDLIIEAREEGIGVYNADTGLRPGVLVNATSGQGVAAAKMAYWGLNRLEYEGKVALMTYSVEQAERERRDVVKAVIDNYPGVEIVENQNFTELDDSKIYDYASNWVTKYGDELDWIIAIADFIAIPSQRAVTTGGLDRDNIFISGIDGGNTAYAVMKEKENGPFMVTSSQPFEWYTHTVFEAIEQVQKEGILPGEEESIVPESRMILGEQVITTEQDLPEPGTSIHQVFDYYGGDPDDPDAWYNWEDADGPYRIQY